MLKLSKRDNKQLIEKAKHDIKEIKSALKKEPIVQRAFKKYNQDINYIDHISIQFVKNLDVSAKTINGKVYLNAKMLDENWKDYFHYACHEIIHVLQHNTEKSFVPNNVDYLDNPEEIEAFQAQLKYKQKTEPKKEVSNYLDELFDRHDIPKDERPAKKKELLNK